MTPPCCHQRVTLVDREREGAPYLRAVCTICNSEVTVAVVPVVTYEVIGPNGERWPTQHVSEGSVS